MNPKIIPITKHPMDCRERTFAGYFSRTSARTTAGYRAHCSADLGAAATSALLAAQLITRPLAKLTGVAKRISNGDLEVQAVENSHDKIGVLANSFNSKTEKPCQIFKGLEGE